MFVLLSDLWYVMTLTIVISEHDNNLDNSECYGVEGQ